MISPFMNAALLIQSPYTNPSSIPSQAALGAIFEQALFKTSYFITAVQSLFCAQTAYLQGKAFLEITGELISPKNASTSSTSNTNNAPIHSEQAQPTDQIQKKPSAWKAALSVATAIAPLIATLGLIRLVNFYRTPENFSSSIIQQCSSSPSAFADQVPSSTCPSPVEDSFSTHTLEKSCQQNSWVPQTITSPLSILWRTSFHIAQTATVLNACHAWKKRKTLGFALVSYSIFSHPFYSAHFPLLSPYTIFQPIDWAFQSFTGLFCEDVFGKVAVAIFGLLPLVYFEDRQRQPKNNEEGSQREEEIRSTQEEVQSLCLSQSLFTGAMYFAENAATFLNSGLNCTVLSNLIKLNG